MAWLNNDNFSAVAFLRPGRFQLIVPELSIALFDLSNTGACLEIASPIGIPDDFVLVTRDDRIEHPCHVIWRTEKRIGVAFN